MRSLGLGRFVTVAALTTCIVGFQGGGQVPLVKLTFRESSICTEPEKGIVKDSRVFSMVGAHVAFIPFGEKKHAVVRDGKRGKDYGFIWPQSLTFSHDGQKLAYAAGDRGSLRLVVDEVESPTKHYEIFPDSIRFSPDDKRIAYVAASMATLFGGYGSLFFVVDGKMVKEHTELNTGTFVFSADSRRFAYIAGAEGKMSMVVDGREGKKYRKITSFGFARDSKRFFFLATDGKEHFAVLDGQEDRRKFESVDVDYPAFNPDSTRFIYRGRRGKQVHLVVDGIESAPYDGLAEVQFSPDGSRYVAIAVRGMKEFVLDNGTEGQPFDAVVRESLLFSPDGKQFAYAVRDGDDYYYVINGVRATQDFDRIIGDSGRFTLDGEHFAFVAEREGKSFAVRDKIEGNGYVSILEQSLMFSVNGENLWYIAKRGDRYFYVVNGEEGPRYSLLLPAILDEPVSSYRIGFLAVKNENQWIRGVLEIQSP